MTARLSRLWLALLLALATVAAVPATSLAAAPAVQSRPTVTASLPWAAVAFAGVHRDSQGHVDAAVVGVVAVVRLPENRIKGQTDPRVLATLKSASLTALSQLENGCAYDGVAVGSPGYVNGDPVNLVDPTGHMLMAYDSTGAQDCLGRMGNGYENCMSSGGVNLHAELAVSSNRSSSTGGAIRAALAGGSAAALAKGTKANAPSIYPMAKVVSATDEGNGIVRATLSDGRVVRLRLEPVVSKAHSASERASINAVNDKLAAEGSSEHLYQVMLGPNEGGADAIRLETSGDPSQISGARVVGNDEIYTPRAGTSIRNITSDMAGKQSPNLILDATENDLTQEDVAQIAKDLSAKGIEARITLVRDGSVEGSMGSYVFDFESAGGAKQNAKEYNDNNGEGSK